MIARNASAGSAHQTMGISTAVETKCLRWVQIIKSSLLGACIPRRRTMSRFLWCRVACRSIFFRKIEKETPEVTFSLRKILSWPPPSSLFKTCPNTRQKSAHVHCFCCLASSSPRWLRLLAKQTKPAVDSAVNATHHFWAERRRRRGPTTGTSLLQIADNRINYGFPPFDEHVR